MIRHYCDICDEEQDDTDVTYSINVAVTKRVGYNFDIVVHNKYLSPPISHSEICKKCITRSIHALHTLPQKKETD